METVYRILKITAALLLVAVLVLMAMVLTRQTPEAPVPETTAPAAAQDPTAPDCTVYDAQGNPLTLSSLRGKPVILNFWASWCGPCKMEMPDFETAYQTYGEDIHFVMVNITDGVQETQEKAQEHISLNRYTFPVYFDLDLDGANQYQVYAIPATYFIDAEGRIVSSIEQMLTAEGLQERIDLLLGE